MNKSNSKQERLREVRETLRNVVPPALTVENMGSHGFMLRRGDHVVAVPQTTGPYVTSVLIFPEGSEDSDVFAVRSACDSLQCDYQVSFDMTVDPDEIRTRFAQHPASG